MWIVAVIALGAVAGIAILAYALQQTRSWSRLPTIRVYPSTREFVIASVLQVVDDLGYAVSHRDEQAVSFTYRYIGDGAGAIPIVHVVILPADETHTRVEVLGGRGPAHYAWHAMAQAFLTRLDYVVAVGVSG